MFDKMVFQAIKTRLAATVPFAKHVGVGLTDISRGKATAVLPDEKFNHNHIGTQHAGALFTLADTASGAALTAVFGQKILGLVPRVRDAQVRYLHGARGEITANAQVEGDLDEIETAVERDGKAEAPVNVSLVDKDGTVVAEMTVNWHVSKPKKK